MRVKILNKSLPLNLLNQPSNLRFNRLLRDAQYLSIDFFETALAGKFIDDPIDLYSVRSLQFGDVVTARFPQQNPLNVDFPHYCSDLVFFSILLKRSIIAIKAAVRIYIIIQGIIT